MDLGLFQSGVAAGSIASMLMLTSAARRGLLAILVLGSIVALGVSPAPGVAGNKTGASIAAKEPAYAASLRKQIPELMKANAIPGAVVLIKSPKQGNWSATFGTAEIGKKVPMSMNDYFRVGSNTKTMTSTVILQLVEEGKLKLDDPISKFRPDVPNGQNITIEELSEMRSGLYSYTFDKGFNETLDHDPKKAWRPNELLKIAFSHPNNFAPDAEYEYCNTNIALLGVVIQKLTGMSAAAAFKERIFKPLGLKHTFLPASADWKIPEPHATGYQFGTNVETIDSYAVPKAQQAAALDGTLLPLDDTDDSPSWGFTAGAAISTANDLAVYVKALVGGGLLDPKLQKLRLNSIKPISPGQPSGIGYGLGIVEFAPNIFGHDGQIPGFSSFMVYNRKTHDTMIIGVNLSASPVTGENAAVEVAKPIIGVLDK